MFSHRLRKTFLGDACIDSRLPSTSKHADCHPRTMHAAKPIQAASRSCLRGDVGALNDDIVGKWRSKESE